MMLGLEFISIMRLYVGNCTCGVQIGITCGYKTHGVRVGFEHMLLELDEALCCD